MRNARAWRVSRRLTWRRPIGSCGWPKRASGAWEFAFCWRRRVVSFIRSPGPRWRHGAAACEMPVLEGTTWSSFCSCRGATWRPSWRRLGQRPGLVSGGSTCRVTMKIALDWLSASADHATWGLALDLACCCTRLSCTVMAVSPVTDSNRSRHFSRRPWITESLPVRRCSTSCRVPAAPLPAARSPVAAVRAGDVSRGWSRPARPPSAHEAGRRNAAIPRLSGHGVQTSCRPRLPALPTLGFMRARTELKSPRHTGQGALDGYWCLHKARERVRPLPRCRVDIDRLADTDRASSRATGAAA